MVILPFDHEEIGKLFLECLVFEALRSSLSLGLVGACYGECILNTVATSFRSTSLMDGDLYLSSSRLVAMGTHFHQQIPGHGCIRGFAVLYHTLVK